MVDTSVWIDHLRKGNPGLATLLRDGHVLGHPWVRGELALGTLADRTRVLALLSNLPQATTATVDDVSGLIEARRLFGRGIGYVDAHLLAATLLTPNARLWTRDRRLEEVAAHLSVAHRPAGR